MGKWASNSEPLRNTCRVSGLEFKAIKQVLGVNWDTAQDSLFTDQRRHRQSTRGTYNEEATPSGKFKILRPLGFHVAGLYNREADFSGLVV